MPQRLSREEFHRWAEGQPVRYERVNGEPVAMSPKRIQHVRVKARVWAALDRGVATAGVDCGPAASPDAIAAANPVIVVEVLSPSTQSIDTGDKLAGYFRVASVQHYLIVSTRRREVIHHRRQGEIIVSKVTNVGSIGLDPPGITIDVAEFYPPSRS